MTSIKAWISAFRPRTLFLAVGTTICGTALAMKVDTLSAEGDKCSLLVFILTTITAILLQLLSNLANDLGDYQHGTDITGKRVGPTRAVQSGVISPKQMKTAVYITMGLSALAGLALIFVALQFMNYMYILLFLILGAAAIYAAIKYTSGKNPYGYKGLGDIFSFLFFGPVPVVGTYFLHTHSITVDFSPWLPAIGLGLMSAAVLNINNMRDMENDKESGKITIPIRIGLEKAKIYQLLLIVGTILCFTIYGIIYLSEWFQFLYIAVFVLFVIIIRNIFVIKENRLLDPYLKYTSMSTFLLSLVFSICINLG
jgi:1,4-dihydroxy-2-naphthoate octaprenyltransferase